jgi:hypothetical protein
MSGCRQVLVIFMSLVSFLVTIASSSCHSQQPDLDIQGVVCTTPDMVASYIVSGNHIPEGYSPVAGATVYIAQTTNPRVPIMGFQVHSTKDGTYKLDLKNLPASTDPNHHYYLVIEKDGYEPITRSFRVGPFSPWLRNTVALKPTGKR